MFISFSTTISTLLTPSQEILQAERAHPAQWGGGGGAPTEPPPSPPRTAAASSAGGGGGGSGGGSSAGSSDGSGTPEDEDEDSSSPLPAGQALSSDKLEVHMFSADGGSAPFSSFFPFPALSAAAAGTSGSGPSGSSLPAVPSTSAAGPATTADTAGELYSDASQEGVCLLPPMVESDDDGDPLMLDDFVVDIFEASLGDKKPPLPSDAVKWGLIPAPGGSWSLSNSVPGLGKLGSSWLSHSGGGGGGGGGGGSSAGGGGSASCLDMLQAAGGCGAPAGPPAGELAGSSAASDARLEVGLTAWPELRLRKMAALHTSTVLRAVSTYSPPTVAPPPPEPPAAAPTDEPAHGQEMVADAVAAILTSIQYTACPEWVESLLALWLSLDCPGTAGFHRSSPLLLQAVRSARRLTLRGWSLLFQALTGRASPEAPSARAAELALDSHELVQAASPLGHVLVLFLTQSVSGRQGQQECGATVCQWFDALLRTLLSASDSARLMLLELLWIAAHSPGFPEAGTPLDAHCKLVQRMLQLVYPGSELGSIVGLVQVIVGCVHRHLSAAGQARTTRGPDCAPPESLAETLLVELLRLASLLVLVPLSTAQHAATTTETQSPPQTDELKASSGGAGASSGSSGSGGSAARQTVRAQLVVDRVLENAAIVEQLLGSAALVTATPASAQEQRTGDQGTGQTQEASSATGSGAKGETTGAALVNALDDLLGTLVAHCSDGRLLVRATVTYLATRSGGSPLRISPLLLGFFLKVLSSSSGVASMIRHRGLEAVFENAALSCRPVAEPPSGGVTGLMLRYLSQRQRRPASSGGLTMRRSAGPGAAPPPVSQHLFNDADGLINVAPLSTITCSSPMALQPEVLVQPTAPHRRSRNPAWSHHFYAPLERTVELHVRLPCAVLLHQVHLQPHCSSLATCPSAVTVEVTSGGPSAPVCTSVPTAGLTFIGIELAQPTVATEVTVRLHRPADSANLGLSQLRLMAATTFGGAALALRGDQAAANAECHLWLRLLDAALQPSADTEVLDRLCAAPRLLERSRALLTAASRSAESARRAVRLLLLLGRHQPELGLGLVRELLRRPPPADGGRQPVRLLYQLATTDDQFIGNRVFELFTWLREGALGADSSPPLGPLHPVMVHCIAAILWTVADMGREEVQQLIPADLVTVVYGWCSRLSADSALKRSLDWVLCALCHLRPALLRPLLHTMGVLVLPGDGANATDDRKDREAEACASVTDDAKHGGAAATDEAAAAAAASRLLPAERLELGGGQLATLAAVLQAPAAVAHAVDAGLLHAVLVQAVHDCCAEMGGLDSTVTDQQPAELDESLTDTDKQSCGGGGGATLQAASAGSQMPALLSLLSAACWEPRVRDWLASDTASVYWLSLVRLLTARPARPAALETELLRLLARCCHGHPANQRRLAATVCDVLAARLEAPAGCRPRLQGFTRRLVLRLLLEGERVSVLLRAAPPAGPLPAAAGGLWPLEHPRLWADTLLVFRTDATVATVLQTALGLESSDGTSSSKDPPPLRADKDQKNQANAATAADADPSGSTGTPVLYKVIKEKKYGKRIRRTADCLPEPATPAAPETRYELVDAQLGDQPLPPAASLSQVLTVRSERLAAAAQSPYVSLTVRQRSGAQHGAARTQGGGSGSPSRRADDLAAAVLAAPVFPSVLSVFAAEGGLALLAGTLPLLFPEGGAPPPAPGGGRTDRPPPADLTDAEWVKVDQPEEDEYVSGLMPLTGGGGGGGSGGTSGAGGSAGLVPVMSPHSIACFGLFLRLPGYAELLLQDQVSARHLLRLSLGVTDDGDGNEILRQPGSAELPLYPFQLMQRLLDATQLTTDDGQLLRRRCLEIGAVNFLLACTAVLSHTETAVQLPALEYQLILATTRNQLLSEAQSQRAGDDRSHQYWAKGTGFGTGSTSQKWNVEQAMLRQKSEEEQVTWLIQTLASYINPGDGGTGTGGSGSSSSSSSSSSSDGTEPAEPTDLLPDGLAERVRESNILTAVCSYLRNDSVLDMARHVPLYLAVLRLLRAFSTSRQLTPLLAQVAPLLANMRQVVDTYTSHLQSSKTRKADKASKSGWPREEEDGGLARLLHNIQHTWRLVEVAVAAPDPAAAGPSAPATAAAAPAVRSLHDIYLETMKPLQFDTHEMIVENPNGGTRFVVSHHFESTMRAAGERSHPARMKRLAQETVTLSTSLPLSFSSSVFVRVDLGRLDLMKVLITAPADTPYSNGCFLFDVYFPYDYPNAPMLINLDTTGRNTVRFNPNLYNDGKVCLSVLNTWHGRPEEKWSPQTSSFLQVLVSIQSLILVAEPYFNEPGYERSRGTPSGTQSSREYDANIRQATVRWAMLEQIRKPCPCFKEVISWDGAGCAEGRLAGRYITRSRPEKEADIGTSFPM
ncbi:Baculoviral IAP repeat-containing protein 6 [Amphibalanus amphitrite]|uniref:Baculoviral IAP repeat-containing protein 6 n=1 Tax=Amphibalanus amphitrite TaxID=1232801 RepID=A0A6A4W6J4_AMPAM|nr:Baculoviral IAP repeat-containing protein 6 [Amphibalanus amphitrite]